MSKRLTGWQRFKKNMRRSQWSIIKRLSETAHVDCPQGKFTVYTSDNAIGKHLYTLGGYEAEWVDQVVNYLKKTNRLSQEKRSFIDVGANIGVIVISLLRKGLFDRCIAIEPTPRNVELLQKNVDENGFTNQTTIFPIAAGSSESTLALELDPTNFGDNRIRSAEGTANVSGHFNEGNRQILHVPVRRIDVQLKEAGINPDDIGLFWIDVQGFEGHALTGAEELLGRGIPAVSEVWPYAIQRSGLTLEAFSTIVQRFWTHVAIPEGDSFRLIEIGQIGEFLNKLGETEYRDVIFLRE